jgi:hypothetical protein
MTDYEIEALYDEALDKLITNYLEGGDIGFSHMVGGWICRELKKRGHLSVMPEREKYLFGIAKTELKKRLRLSKLKGSLDGFVFRHVGCNRDCEACRSADTCKSLVNYSETLVFYDWLRDKYGDKR